MIRTLRSVATLIIFLLEFGTFHSYSAVAEKPARAGAATPDTGQSIDELSQNGPHLTLWQARKMIVIGFQTCPVGIVSDPRSFRFSFDSLEFDARSRWGKDAQHYSVDLKSQPPVSAKRGFGGVYRLKDESGRDFPVKQLAWGCQETAELVAKAINRLREMAGDEGMLLRNFSQRAAAWRALAPKPPVPEEVQAQRLLAETAFKEGNLGKALYHYETGVELYPVWPEGRFNAALIAAELKFYNDAVEQMRVYLELAPDAPDAPSARDQIVIWQDQAAQPVASSATETEQSTSRMKRRRH